MPTQKLKPNTFRREIKDRVSLNAFKVPSSFIIAHGVKDGQIRNIKFETENGIEFVLDARITSGCEISLPRDYQKSINRSHYVDISFLDGNPSLASGNDTPQDNERQPSYFIIGSKYQQENGHYDDVFPRMVHKGAVSTGFASEHDLHKLYGKSETEIITKLKALGEPQKSYTALKRFLNLRAGDLIAIKGSGAPRGHRPNLTIIGYAVVVKREGEVYQYDPPPGLGHMINVDFIEADVIKEVPLGYGQTVHKLTDPKHIKSVFSYYCNYHYPTAAYSRTRSGTTTKNLKAQIHVVNSVYVTDAAHDRLQQAYYNFLVDKYGSEKVNMEKDFVDLSLTTSNGLTFYEIKHYSTAMKCLRMGLGQIIEYSWSKRISKQEEIRLVILGPVEPIEDERKYIQYLKKHLDFEFDYEYFEL